LKKFRRRLEVRAVRNREVAAIAIARNRPQSPAIAHPKFFKHETKKRTPTYSNFHLPSYSSKKTPQFLAAFPKAIAGWR
jgi:hypothetical protein